MHPYTYYLGRRHEVSAGGTASNWGMDSDQSKPPSPYFQFLLGFRLFYFGNNGKPEKWGKFRKFSFKIRYFFCGQSPEFRTGRGTHHPIPPPGGMGVGSNFNSNFKCYPISILRPDLESSHQGFFFMPPK